MAQSSLEHFKRGKNFLSKDKLERAAKAFEKAYKADRENPEYMSYYGMSAAMKWGSIGLGMELCTKAIKKKFTTAEYYANLARVYLAAGNKRGAVSIVRKGLKHDQENETLNEMLVTLGARKRAPVTFLKRSNPLNRFLGTVFASAAPEVARRKRPRRKEKAGAATRFKS